MSSEDSRLCPSEKHMECLGAELAVRLRPGMLMTISGELGAGKSVLARAVIHALGYSGLVKSPTYTLIETYRIAVPKFTISGVSHLDLYRLAEPEELLYLGVDDIFSSDDLVIVEWPEKGAGVLPLPAVDVSIHYLPDGGRRVTMNFAAEHKCSESSILN